VIDQADEIRNQLDPCARLEKRSFTEVRKHDIQPCRPAQKSPLLGRSAETGSDPKRRCWSGPTVCLRLSPVSPEGRTALALAEAMAARRTVLRSLFSGAGDVLRAELPRQIIDRIAALPDL
jgi:hypothetical protein